MRWPRGGAGEAATHIRESMDERQARGRLAADRVAARAIRPAIRTGAMHRGLSPDLMWLVAELAVSPFAHALQRMLFGSADGRRAARRARRVESRLLPGVRIVAGRRRSRRRPPHAALLVLLVRLGADDLRVHLLREERRGIRHRRARRRAEGSPHRSLRQPAAAT